MPLLARHLAHGPDRGRGSLSAAHRVAVIPGDGIGQEVVLEGLRALEAASAGSALS